MAGLKNTSSTTRTLILISVLSLVCFFVIAYSRGLFDDLNMWVNAWLTGTQAEGLTDVANLVSSFFDTTVLLAITLPIAGLMLYKSHIDKALLLLGAMGGDALLLNVSKTVIASPRPLNGLILEQSNSFPSGHVTSTIVFFGMLTYFAWQNRKTITKFCLAAITPILAVMVAFDRLYLNVHWLSDVLAAPFLALFVLVVTILVVQYLTGWHTRRRQSSRASTQTPVLINRLTSFFATLCLRGEALNGRAITNKAHTLPSGEIQ
jgi:membrane-associated phospholipid phosphatase